MPIRCLVVEDEPLTRDMFALTLRRANIDVDLAGSGQAALKYLKTNHPDVILVDLHMPDITGFDVINAIRSDPQLNNITVIAMTASPSSLNTPEAKKADAFFAKPFDFQRLIDVIYQHVRVKT